MRASAHISSLSNKPDAAKAFGPEPEIAFVMWSVFFGFLAANYLGWFGYNTLASLIIHIGILVPLAFTNAVFVDAERDGAQWLKEWKEEQSRYKLVTNRLKAKNFVIWNPNKKSK